MSPTSGQLAKFRIFKKHELLNKKLLKRVRINMYDVSTGKKLFKVLFMNRYEFGIEKTKKFSK